MGGAITLRPRCLILAHGAGSSPRFLLRAFPAAVTGADVYALGDRCGSVAAVQARLEQAAAGLRPRYRQLLIGGVSIGAHAAAAAAGACGGLLDGAVLALPAWSGPALPNGPTAAAAAAVAALGAAGVLQQLAADPHLAGDWVTHELRDAWRDRQGLAGELLAASLGAAPDRAAHACIQVPALVIALAEDPFHPVSVAQAWATAIPRAELIVLGRQQPARREVFGAAVAAWADRISGPR